MLVADDFLRNNGLVGQGKAHNHHAFPRLDQVGGASVHDNIPRSRRALQGVCFQTIAGRDGGHEHFLPGLQIHRRHQIGRNLDAAFILNIAAGNHGTMDF